MKIGLLGKSGRMGQIVERLALLRGWDVIELSFDKEKLHAQLIGLDVALEFSSKEGLDLLLDVADLPLVLASTGLNDELKEKIKEKASKIPVFYSANYSVGLFKLLDLLENAGLEAENAQITETHHINKKDAPSGTALLIQERLAIPSPIMSIREEDVFGIHEISYKLGEEILSFKHTALNREIFATGALAACEFIFKAKAGLYSMKDLLQSGARF